MTEVQTAIEEAPSRLDHLRGYFLDIADPSIPITTATAEYIRHGGSLRLCLNEIIELEGPTPEDVKIADTRAAYTEAVLTRPRLRKRGFRASRIAEAEGPYIDAIVAKVSAVIDASTAEDALAVHQLPTVIEHASFTQKSPSDIERLAANHLYILMDVALKEHVQRREAIDAHSNRSLRARLVGNRVIRASVAAGIFAATVSPKVGMVPIGGETMTEDVELGLKVLSGTILGLDGPEAIRMQYLAMAHNHRSEQLLDQLAENQQLSDLSFRIIYGSTRYGGSSEPKTVTGRSGSADKGENLRRFAKMDDEFYHLNNDPGGKPYTPWQAQGYAARFLIERASQIDELIAGSKSAKERRQLYLELTREIISEDLARLRKGLSVSKARKQFMRGIALVPAALFPSAASLASEASTLGRDTAKTLKKSKGSQ